MQYLFIIIWFLFLIKWADFLVDWASSIAKKYKISNLVIWLTIVAFWTSAPELVVSLISALWWNSDIAVSNVIWSNISNILFILWVTAILYPLWMPKSTIRYEIPFLLFITVLFSLFLYDNYISRYEAFILVLLFIWFLCYTFKISKNQENNEEQEIEVYSSIKSAVFIFLGLFWLIYWWKLIVDNAQSIAQSFWVPDSFIWVTIIAIWTSLPELASSVVAALKKNTDMAIGWVVWSNIFNVLWIIWLPWLITRLNWYEWISVDIFINIIAVLLLFLFAFTLKRFFLDRIEWAILFSLFILYISYRIYTVL